MHKSGRIAEFLLYLSTREGRPITPMQLLKLAYISHGWMLGLYGKPLTCEAAEAWEYGPVLPSLYHQFKRFKGSCITHNHAFAPADFDSQESSIMTQVWDAYSGYTGIQLSALTHKPGTPWDITRRDSGAGAVIPNDLIAEHYRKLAQHG